MSNHRSKLWHRGQAVGKRLRRSACDQTRTLFGRLRLRRRTGPRYCLGICVNQGAAAELFKVVVWTSLALLALGGCSAKVEERPLEALENGAPIVVEVYRSIEDCRRVGRLSLQQCREGSRQAMARHPLFAEKWNHPSLCREIHGLDCTRFEDEGSSWWSAKPVAFLACFPKDGQCQALGFAPVYSALDFGEYTGQGGGGLASPSSGWEARSWPARREVRERARRYPPI